MKFMIKNSNMPVGSIWPALANRLVCTVFICAVLMLSTGAEAQVTTKAVVVMSQANGKCIRVADGAVAIGAAVKQWTCDESTGSRWRLAPHDGMLAPQVQVIADHSGQCLTVSGGSAADGQPIVQSTCTGADSQLWSVEAVGNFYQLRAKHTGKCADVALIPGASFETLIQYPCEGSNNQLWSFSEGFLAPTESVRIANESSNLCVDIQYGSADENASVIQWDCIPGAINALWSLSRAGDGYQVKVQSSGKCLAPAGGSTATDATMVQVTCGPALSQVWSLSPIGTGGDYALRNKSSTLCLDIVGDQASGDAFYFPVQRPCAAVTTQAWRLTNTWGTGSWSERKALPIVPVGAAALRNNKVLLWSSYDAFTWGGGPNLTQTVVYDLASDTAAQAQVSNTDHDMFCPGTAMLADGRVLVNGGSTSWKTSIYDPVADIWTQGGNMNVARGYNADTLTSTGKVFTIGGSWSGYYGQDKKGELWSPSSNSWAALNGIPSSAINAPDPAGVYRGDNHAWLFGVEGGKVFHAGPSAQMNWMSVTGSGSYKSAGYRGNAGYTINGNAVMYDINRILTVGGAPSYDSVYATTRAYTIDIRSGVKVRQSGSMTYARSFANSIVLPDGQVFVAGGQTYTRLFSDTTAVLPGEMWNPATGTFTIMAAASIPRTYHSVAVLLPDARVLVGGGGLCGNGCAYNHADFEYYSPPYLYGPDGRDAVRPEITSAPPTAAYNSPIDVTTSDSSVTSFVMIRMGSATHAIDNDQRRIPLTISVQAGTSYTVQTPANAGIATPGYYMLFGLNAAGVPSKAAIIRVG